MAADLPRIPDTELERLILSGETTLQVMVEMGWSDFKRSGAENLVSALHELRARRADDSAKKPGRVP